MKRVVEVDFSNLRKAGQRISGDVFLQSRERNLNRIVCTLSDGMGSGVKANVLANLTATMAQRFVLNNLPMETSAGIIMETLPVCSERHISYATFTILDISQEGRVKIIEYDNPTYIWVHEGRLVDPVREEISLDHAGVGHKRTTLYKSEVVLTTGDRLIFFSDGVTQAGMGSYKYPLGWRRGGVCEYAAALLKSQPQISARDLASKITLKASIYDGRKPKDDITCAVLSYRRPRNTLVITGAPFNSNRDSYMAESFLGMDGKKIISGGTTANILSRELAREITVNLRERSPGIPPSSNMDGADLVCEGMLTLNRVAEYLENRTIPRTQSNAAERMVHLLLDSDCVHFMVGTKINEAHQNPDLPVEMGIRRITVRRIVTALEDNYLKEITIEYV